MTERERAAQERGEARGRGGDRVSDDQVDRPSADAGATTYWPRSSNGLR
jgi:hypothetical protein